MSRIAEAAERLSRRMLDKLVGVICPRCDTATMHISYRDHVEDALKCLACSREVVSERRSESERRIIEEVGEAQVRAMIEMELDRALQGVPTLLKKEICAELGITRSRLDRRLAREPIEGGRKVREQPNRWRFPKAAAEEWIESHKDSFPPVPARS